MASRLSRGAPRVSLCGISRIPRSAHQPKEVLKKHMKTLRNLRRDEKGFTLIEIMIVVLIIGILLAIAIPNFVTARQTSQKKSCLSNLKQIDAAKEQWAMDGHTGTPTAADLAGATAYIKGAMPVCPTDGTAYTINAVGTDPTCANAALGHVL